MSNKKAVRNTYRGIWSDIPADAAIAELCLEKDSSICSTESSVKSEKKKNGKEFRNIAIFPGTFDPFTIGHKSIVDRALALFDEIIIAIGINEAKRGYFTVDQRKEMINTLYQDNDKVSVASYKILTVDFAQERSAKYILRGIRSVNDFEYEKTIADVNRELTGVETIIFFTEPKYTHISSTIVRELIRYKKNVSEFVPAGIRIEGYIKK